MTRTNGQNQKHFYLIPTELCNRELSLNCSVMITIHSFSVPTQVCVYLSGLCITYGDELLSDHRQHLNVDAVELVKAAPGARLSQSAEEAAHHLQDGRSWPH